MDVQTVDYICTLDTGLLVSGGGGGCWVIPLWYGCQGYVGKKVNQQVLSLYLAMTLLLFLETENRIMQFIVGLTVFIPVSVFTLVQSFLTEGTTAPHFCKQHSSWVACNLLIKILQGLPLSNSTLPGGVFN